VQNTPDFDSIIELNAKHEIWVSAAGPRTQSGKIQFVTVSRRSASGVAADVRVCQFQIVDKSLRDLGRHLPVVIQCLQDVAIRASAPNQRCDALRGHASESASFARSAPQRRHTLPQRREVRFVGGTGDRRPSTLDEHRSQLHPILVASDQFANVFARRAVAALCDLLLDEVA
jgi:hypothetical protein